MTKSSWYFRLAVFIWYYRPGALRHCTSVFQPGGPWNVVGCQIEKFLAHLFVKIFLSPSPPFPISNVNSMWWIPGRLHGCWCPFVAGLWELPAVGALYCLIVLSNFIEYWLMWVIPGDLQSISIFNLSMFIIMFFWNFIYSICCERWLVGFSGWGWYSSAFSKIHFLIYM